MQNQNYQTHEPGVISELAQSATILIPLAYLLGSNYAKGYFTELKCGWAYKFLTFQETLSYALPTALAILLGFILTLNLLLDSIKYIKILKFYLFVPGSILAIALVANHSLEFMTVKVIMWIIAFWISVIFGSYAADTLYILRSPNKEGLKGSVAYLLACSFSIFGAANMFGSASAHYDIENMDRIFPRLSEGYISSTAPSKRLIAKVGDKYLISDLEKTKRTFSLRENLGNFTIQLMPSSSRQSN